MNGPRSLSWRVEGSRRPAVASLSRRWAALPAWQWQAAVMLPLAVAFLWSAFGLRAPLALSGDEPHYLAVAQSLSLYGTLDQHLVLYHHDYYAYFPQRMSSHALHLDGHLYPLHYIGLPLVVLPGFAFAGAGGALATMATAALGVCWLTLRLAARVAKRTPAALAVLGMGLSAPFVLNAATIYPDMLGALFLLIVVELTSHGALTARRVLWSGVALAMTPWVHVKLLVPMAFLILWTLYRLWDEASRYQRAEAALPRRRRRRAGIDTLPSYAQRAPRNRPETNLAPRGAAYIIGLPVLSVLALLAFNGVVYGTPTLTAQFSLRGETLFSGNPLTGALGQIFAQGQGMLGAAPFLLLGFPGLVALWRRERALAILVVAATYPFWAITLSYHDWWGGDSPPLRYLLEMLPFWTVGTAVLLDDLRGARMRAVTAGLGLLSLVLTLLLPWTARAGWPLPEGTSGPMQALGDVLHIPLTALLPLYTVGADDHGSWATPLLLLPWAAILAGLWIVFVPSANARLAAFWAAAAPAAAARLSAAWRTLYPRP